MMADGASREDFIKLEADFECHKTDNLDHLTIQTNGEQKIMERERVKKKAPGKAVIMTGATTRPPTHDDISDAKEYVMQYTDIFASEGDSAVYDDDGGEIVESSDTEIVGHSEEGTRYAKDTDNVDDSDHSLDGPPPLDSEDDYEYDDSDFAFSPPPIGSDGSEGERALSSLHSSPAKSGESYEKLDIQKEKVSRRESYDSEHGYREGPPPLDSDEENVLSTTVENGVKSEEEDAVQDNEDQLSEEEHDLGDDHEDGLEDDENADLIRDETRDVDSSECNESLASDDLPEDEQRILRTQSPTEDEEQQISRFESNSQSPEPEQTEVEETEVLVPASELPVYSESVQAAQEDDLSGSESSERVESPERMDKYVQPESDTDAPLLVNAPPEVDIPTLTSRKNKTSLKEKGNRTEKSSLLMSDSGSEDESVPQLPPKEHCLNLSDSESETNEKIEPAKPVKPVLRDSDVKRTRTVKDASSRNEGAAFDAKKKTSGKQTTENKTQKPKELRTRDAKSIGKESIENISNIMKVSKSASVAKGTDSRRKHVPGSAVKDEKSKTSARSQQSIKYAPGLAVKEAALEKNAREGKAKETKSDNRRAHNFKDTSMRKQTKEAQSNAKTTTTQRKDIKSENVVQKKEKSPVGNGEAKRVKQRPKIFKSKYVAVATEDDYDDDQEEIPDQKPEKTRNELRGTHKETRKARIEDDKRQHGSKSSAVHEHQVKGHKHERSKHVWLCRDDEIHKLIAQKASLLKEYESGSLAGRNVFSGQKSRHRGDNEDSGRSMPDVGFAGSRSKPRSTRPVSEVLHDREPYSSRKRENRRSLQHRYSGSSSEDDDERTNKQAGNLRAEKAASGGTFSVGMASRNLSKREMMSDSDHEETCEYCAAEKAAQKAQERDLAWEGPHHPRNLLLGVVYTAKYLGSSQIMSPQSPDRNVRMQQAQEAVGRIKVPEGEDQPTTDVDLFISTERIKVVNSSNKDIMMDHALRTVSFIADIGDVLVLMARRPPGNQENVLETKPSASQILASVAKAETDPKMIKITCHVFQAPEAQVIAKSIGQAFNVAYQEFLRTNGISEDSIEDVEYNCVLEAQKILGEDLSLLSDASKSREVVVNKKPGESLGVMIVESGWGSMIPTAIIAHLAKEGPAAKSGRLNVGDQILSINNTSLVGLPLPECQTIIKNSRPGTKVVIKAVSCPPTVQVVVNRPDTKYQLGFSVQNGMICSLMRGSIAERGGVRVGHRIIEINSESVVATSHQHIVDLLASTTGEIRMKTMPASMYRLLVGLDTPQYI